MKICFMFKVLLLAASSLLGGCIVAESWYSPYEKGVLQGEGVRIEAEDGSFILKEGRFSPPFQTVQTHGSHSLAYAAYVNGAPPNGIKLIHAHNIALQHGAKRVKVYHPAANEPLHGVLALNKRMPRYSTGPSGQSYLIRIPDSYVNDAVDGRMSVVYEPVAWKGHPNGKFIGWALWLSDTPF